MILEILKTAVRFYLARKMLSAVWGKQVLRASLCSTSRWCWAAELGGATDISCPQPADLAQRHHPHAQVLPHLLRQRERSQAPVPALLSEADPTHCVPTAQDLPSSHQDRLNEPQPPAVLAARYSAGGAQLPDRWWGRGMERCFNSLYEWTSQPRSGLLHTFSHMRILLWCSGA